MKRKFTKLLAISLSLLLLVGIIPLSALATGDGTVNPDGSVATPTDIVVNVYTDPVESVEAFSPGNPNGVLELKSGDCLDSNTQNTLAGVTGADDAVPTWYAKYAHKEAVEQFDISGALVSEVDTTVNVFAVAPVVNSGDTVIAGLAGPALAPPSSETYKVTFSANKNRYPDWYEYHEEPNRPGVKDTAGNENNNLPATMTITQNSDGTYTFTAPPMKLQGDPGSNVFLYWVTDVPGVYYWPGVTYTITGDVHLYGWYGPKNIDPVQTAVLIYHPNGGLPSDPQTTQHAKGSSVVIQQNPFVREGYTFLGWNTDQNAAEGDPAYTPGNSTTLNENLTLYAIWGKTPARNVELIYDPNGGTGERDVSTPEIGESVTIKNNMFTREGYTFQGWNEDPDATAGDPAYAAGTSVTIEANLTLYAIWKADPIVITVSPISDWKYVDTPDPKFKAEATGGVSEEMLAEIVALLESKVNGEYITREDINGQTPGDDFVMSITADAIAALESKYGDEYIFESEAANFAVTEKDYIVTITPVGGGKTYDNNPDNNGTFTPGIFRAEASGDNVNAEQLALIQAEKLTTSRAENENIGTHDVEVAETGEFSKKALTDKYTNVKFEFKTGEFKIDALEIPVKPKNVEWTLGSSVPRPGSLDAPYDIDTITVLIPNGDPIPTADDFIMASDGLGKNIAGNWDITIKGGKDLATDYPNYTFTYDIGNYKIFANGDVWFKIMAEPYKEQYNKQPHPHGGEGLNYTVDTPAGQSNLYTVEAVTTEYNLTDVTDGSLPVRIESWVVYYDGTPQTTGFTAEGDGANIILEHSTYQITPLNVTLKAFGEESSKAFGADDPEFTWGYADDTEDEFLDDDAPTLDVVREKGELPKSDYWVDFTDKPQIPNYNITYLPGEFEITGLEDNAIILAALDASKDYDGLRVDVTGIEHDYDPDKSTLPAIFDTNSNLRIEVTTDTPDDVINYVPEEDRAKNVITGVEVYLGDDNVTDAFEIEFVLGHVWVNQVKVTFTVLGDPDSDTLGLYTKPAFTADPEFAVGEPEGKPENGEDVGIDAITRAPGELVAGNDYVVGGDDMYTVTGNTNGNYIVEVVPGTLKILRNADLRVEVAAVGGNKTYDGTPLATIPEAELDAEKKNFRIIEVSSGLAVTKVTVNETEITHVRENNAPKSEVYIEDVVVKGVGPDGVTYTLTSDDIDIDISARDELTINARPASIAADNKNWTVGMVREPLTATIKGILTDYDDEPPVLGTDFELVSEGTSTSVPKDFYPIEFKDITPEKLKSDLEAKYQGDYVFTVTTGKYVILGNNEIKLVVHPSGDTKEFTGAEQTFVGYVPEWIYGQDVDADYIAYLKANVSVTNPGAKGTHVNETETDYPNVISAVTVTAPDGTTLATYEDGENGTNSISLEVKEGYLTITPADLTIVPQDGGKDYGDPNPEYDWEVEASDAIKENLPGLKDLLKVVLDREEGEDVNGGKAYSIFVESAAVIESDSLYARDVKITSDDTADFIIDPVDLTITAVSSKENLFTNEVHEMPAPFILSIGDTKFSDKVDEASLLAKFTASDDNADEVEPLMPGAYTIYIKHSDVKVNGSEGNAADATGNYNIILVNGTYTILAPKETGGGWKISTIDQETTYNGRTQFADPTKTAVTFNNGERDLILGEVTGVTAEAEGIEVKDNPTIEADYAKISAQLKSGPADLEALKALFGEPEISTGKFTIKKAKVTLTPTLTPASVTQGAVSTPGIRFMAEGAEAANTWLGKDAISMGNNILVEKGGPIRTNANNHKNGIIYVDNVRYNKVGTWKVVIRGEATEYEADNYDVELGTATLAVSAPGTTTPPTDPVIPAGPVTPAGPAAPAGPVAPVPPVEPDPPTVIEDAPTPVAAPDSPAISDDVADDVTPAAAPTGAWALLNLISAILCAVFAILLFITAFKRNKKKEQDEEAEAEMQAAAAANEEDEDERNKKSGIGWRILSIILGVISPIVFLLTENIRLPMIFTDRWTLLMILLLVVQVIGMLLMRRARNQESDEDDEEAAAEA